MDVYDAIRTRRSVRAYDGRPVDRDVLCRLIAALRLAPSAANIQPWKFIFVTEQGAKEGIARACKERMWIARAAMVVVGCGFPEKAYKTMGGFWNSVDVDLAIALDHLSLAARSEGLGSCWIGAFKEDAVRDLLGIPAAAKVVSLMAVGYPADPQAFRTEEERRKQTGEIVSFEKY